MTKQHYLDMCQMLGTEPKEEEIPVEYEDLLSDVHEALNIYSKLRDDWDGMAGIYLGKNFSGLEQIFNLYAVPEEDRRTLFELLNLIDGIRAKIINSKKKTK